VPTSGRSAIELEQPPNASVDSNSAPSVNALLSRSDIRPEIPLMFISSTVARCPNQCHSKRLKPKQQIPSVGLQYDRTEIPFVAVQHVSRRDQLKPPSRIICAVTNLK
jgi:hypothetical protein